MPEIFLKFRPYSHIYHTAVRLTLDSCYTKSANSAVKKRVEAKCKLRRNKQSQSAYILSSQSRQEKFH